MTILHLTDKRIEPSRRLFVPWLPVVPNLARSPSPAEGKCLQHR
ncbi:hypothetical protein ACFOEZ_17910 [Tianweitania populi]|nr:hypothetical protein [Tianweitania populi]